ncbi:hypothetical protein K438DRAFT_1772794 [Mycena galopus ATCC 62051]|nr:hypothetical protein K438DRAFT_1772794 [Mycena galopus ATCC 62051]
MASHIKLESLPPKFWFNMCHGALEASLILSRVAQVAKNVDSYPYNHNSTNLAALYPQVGPGSARAWGQARIWRQFSKPQLNGSSTVIEGIMMASTDLCTKETEHQHINRAQLPLAENLNPPGIVKASNLLESLRY